MRIISIVFFGTDQYSKIVLNELKKDKNLKIVLVVDDKAKLAEVLKISKRPDLGILASFGMIIPEEILNFPKMGILNIHPSLLPKYRGATPVPSAILAGEKETGVSIIKLDGKVDHGPIVTQVKEEINPDDTAQTLLTRLFTLGVQILSPILPDYVEGKIKLREQDHSRATFTKRFTRDDGRLDWSKPADYNERFIRAMSPWPGAFTSVKLPARIATPARQLDSSLGGGQSVAGGKVKKEKLTKRLKILHAHVEKNLILNTYYLILDTVQLEGKNPVSFKQFQEGYNPELVEGLPEAKITP